MLYYFNISLCDVVLLWYWTIWRCTIYCCTSWCCTVLRLSYVMLHYLTFHFLILRYFDITLHNIELFNVECSTLQFYSNYIYLQYRKYFISNWSCDFMWPRGQWVLWYYGWVSVILSPHQAGPISAFVENT